MKIREDNLAGPQQFDFDRLRFFDLHDHVRAPVNLAGRPDYADADGPVIGVERAAAVAGVALDEHGVTGLEECFTIYRQETDPVFVVLNLAWDADDHTLTVGVPREIK